MLQIGATEGLSIIRRSAAKMSHLKEQVFLFWQCLLLVFRVRRRFSQGCIFVQVRQIQRWQENYGENLAKTADRVQKLLHHNSAGQDDFVEPKTHIHSRRVISDIPSFFSNLV